MGDIDSAQAQPDGTEPKAISHHVYCSIYNIYAVVYARDALPQL